MTSKKEILNFSKMWAMKDSYLQSNPTFVKSTYNNFEVLQHKLIFYFFATMNLKITEQWKQECKKGWDAKNWNLKLS